MSRITERTRKLSNAYAVLFKRIENESDLRHYRLTITEYRAACDILKELSHEHVAKTFMSSVAEFYETLGFSVKLSGINFTIAC